MYCHRLGRPWRDPIGGLDFVDRNGQAELNWAGTLMQCVRIP
jgi:hypothetical protein